MYAIVKVSGYQCLVKQGDVVTVPRLEVEPGVTVPMDVLFLRTADQTLVGSPTVAGARVTAEVLDHIRADKVTIHKFIRRENYRRKKGHRQQLTRVKITEIGLGTRPCCRRS